MRLSQRLVVSDSPGVGLCRVAIREMATQKIRVSVMSCCYFKTDICVAQGSARTLSFHDMEDVDYTGASEITFDVWQGGIEGESLLSFALSAGTITLAADNVFQAILSGAASLALPVGSHHSEAWVTLSSGVRRLVGMGKFTVIDTRKHDE
jgi:hypothetical protein